MTGCATGGSSGLYQWGGYNNLLYQQYKDSSQIPVMREQLTEHIDQLEKTSRPVAPGLYAELGTLYLETGDTERAISYYELERQTWPESEVLMSTMIKTLERSSSGKAKP